VDQVSLTETISLPEHLLHYELNSALILGGLKDQIVDETKMSEHFEDM
jgi:hypothetical protein